MNSVCSVNDHPASVDQPRAYADAVRSVVSYGDRADLAPDTKCINAELAHTTDGAIAYRQISGASPVYPILRRRKGARKGILYETICAHICAADREAVEIDRDVVRGNHDWCCVGIFSLQVPRQLVTAWLRDGIGTTSSSQGRLIDQHHAVHGIRAKWGQRHGQ